MKKLICNTLLIAVVFLLASCSSKTEYVNALPHDASVVVSVDVNKMVEKSGLNEENGKVLVDRISNALKSGLSAKSYKAVENILKDPSSSGISFKDKIYLFSFSGADIFGILAKLDDDDDFESLIETLKEDGLSSEVRDGDKCKWAKVGNVICGFNNGTLMLLSNGSDETSGLKETLMSYMRQDADKSFCATPYFKKLSAAKGEIAVAFNMSILPSDLAGQLKMGMSADMKLEDLKYLADVSFEKGIISCTVESMITDQSIINAFEQVDKATMNVNNELLSYYPSNSIIWCGMSIKGGDLYDVLSKNKAIEQMLNDPMIPIDINDIFSSIDGNLSLGYLSTSMDDLLIYGKVTSDEFMSAFDELIPLVAMTCGQMKLKKTGKATYEFGMMGENLWFGVKNGMLYITNNSALASKACEKYPNSLLDTKAASCVGSSRLVAFLNAQQIVSQMSIMSNYNLKMAQPVLNYLDYATIQVSDSKNARMDIIMKDKNVNALQLLVSELQKI